jgi:hypothetical protein
MSKSSLLPRYFLTNPLRLGQVLWTDVFVCKLEEQKNKVSANIICIYELI